MKNIPFTESEIKEIKEHYSHELEKLHKRANEIRGILQKMEGKKSDEIDNITAYDPAINNKINKKEVSKKFKVTAEKTVAKPSEKKKTGAQKIEKAPVSKSVSTASKKTSSLKPKVITVVKTAKSTKAVKAKDATSINAKKSQSLKTIKSGAPKKGRTKSLTSKHAVYESFIIEYITKQSKLVSSKTILDSVEKEFNVPAADYSKMKATVTVILSKSKAGGKIKDYPQSGTKTKLYGLIEWFDNTGKVKDLSKLK